LKIGIDKLEKEITRWHQKNPESRRLATIPGIGPITASAMSATIADPHQFKPDAARSPNRCQQTISPHRP
jgi:transposase